LGHAYSQINREHTGKKAESITPNQEETICSPIPYLRLARHDGDAGLTPLQLLVADERAHVDRHLDAAILAVLHGHGARRRPYNNDSCWPQSTRCSLLASVQEQGEGNRTGEREREREREREGGVVRQGLKEEGW